MPKLALLRIVSAGNVAGEGAKIAALSVQERAAAIAIVDQVEYVEASGRTDFKDLFVDQLPFPAIAWRRPRSSRAARSRSTSARSRGGRARPRRPPAAAGAPQPPGAHRAGGRGAVGERLRPRRRRLRRLRLARRGRRALRRARPRRLRRHVLRRLETAAARAEEPGTYFLTDFLVRAFDHVVWRGLGLDRHPDLRDDYFRHYRRVIWLAQVRTPALEIAARAAADRLGLALEVRDVGDAGLASRLRRSPRRPREAPVMRTSCPATRSSPRGRWQSSIAAGAGSCRRSGWSSFSRRRSRYFRKAGQKIEGQNVKLDPDWVLEQVKKAPSSFTAAGAEPRAQRHGRRRLDGLRVGLRCPFVREGFERREATMHDFERFSKLSQAFPELDSAGGTICEPNDMPLDSRHLDMVLRAPDADRTSRSWAR